MGASDEELGASSTTTAEGGEEWTTSVQRGKSNSRDVLSKSFDLRPQTGQVFPLPSSSSTFASSSNLPPIPRQDVQPRTVAASREAEQIRAESANKIKELEAELQMYRHQDQLRSSQKRHADNSQLKATPLRLGAEPRSRETATIPPSTTRARVFLSFPSLGPLPRCRFRMCPSIPVHRCPSCI